MPHEVEGFSPNPKHCKRFFPLWHAEDSGFSIRGQSPRVSSPSDTDQDAGSQMLRPLLSAAARNTRFSVREALKAVQLSANRDTGVDEFGEAFPSCSPLAHQRPRYPQLAHRMPNSAAPAVGTDRAMPLEGSSLREHIFWSRLT